MLNCSIECVTFGWRQTTPINITISPLIEWIKFILYIRICIFEYSLIPVKIPTLFIIILYVFVSINWYHMEISNVTKTDFHRQYLNKRTECMKSNQFVALMRESESNISYEFCIFTVTVILFLCVYQIHYKSLQFPEYTKVMQMLSEKMISAWRFAFLLQKTMR